MKLRALCLCLILCCAMPGPVDAGKREDLRRAEEALEQSRKQEEALREKAQAVEESLNNIKKKLVQVNRTLRKKETESVEVSRNLGELNQQIDQKNATLDVERERLRSMVDASVRLSRMQPEALVMMPDIGEETVTAARAMRLMSVSMKQLSDKLAQDLQQLKALQANAKKQQESLAKITEELRKERDAMKQLAKERSSLYTAINADYQSASKRVKSLASEAHNLKELVAALEEKSREELTKKAEGKKVISPSVARVNAQRGKLRSFARAKGDIRAPAAGILQKTFGSGGSKGITIVTPASASVSAPYDGEVVYAGNFMDYGRMVILKHTDNFHTLVSGLASINISTGEFLLEGEPIGAMGNDENKRKLYVELRKNNHPVNPASWIAGL